MTNRERWIMYPLMFFTFLLAARDTYNKPKFIDCQVVTCRQMQVVSDEGNAVVILGTTLDESGNEAGVMITYGPPAGSGQLDAPRPLSPTDGEAERPSAVEIGWNEGGGFLVVTGHDVAPHLRLQHDRDRRQSGLTALQIGEEDPHWSNTVAWPTATQPENSEQTEPASADGGSMETTTSD